jgi:uncharacterized damage-inducible protein DinB
MNSTSPHECRALIASVIETLQQGELLLAEISDANYTRKVPLAFNASIGGHYRHCLDHFQNVLNAAPAGDLNYDHRERNTLIEQDRYAALNATRTLREHFEQLDPQLARRPLSVTCQTSHTTGNSPTTSSTVEREIMYAIAHAVHHYALIGVIGGILGLPLPPGFGIAPSTLQHQTKTTRAGL